MNELEAPEGIEPQEGENLEDISPSLKGGIKKPKTPKASAKTPDLAQKPTEDIGKKGARQLAKNFGRAIAHAVRAAITAIAGYIGWPALIGCLVVFLIIMIIFGGLMVLSINGYFGKTLPQPAGKNDVNVKELIAASKEVVLDNPRGKHYKIEFLNKRDLEYLESGQIDKRLAAALNYLQKKHGLIRISHIVSGYEDMKVNPESGSFHDTQITKNISAHKAGLAADIDEIDGVKEQCKCGSSIPVQVAWQAIGENPFGPAVPDVLQDIKSPADIAQEQVKEALKEMGVQGLDQPDLAEKLQTISGIESVFDLTKPQVIAALEGIGITGIDNDELQQGLKRLQALQQLYELAPQDVNALTTGQGANLLSQIGIKITPELQESIQKYQQAQVLETIASIEDLNRPEVQQALTSFEIDVNDPNFRTSMEKMLAAKTIVNWQGSFDDPAFQKALTIVYPQAGGNFKEALALYQAYKNGFGSPAGEIIVDLNILQGLEQSNISIDNPTAQEIFSDFRAFQQIADPNLWGSALKNQALTYAGLTLNESTWELYEKYQAGQYIINYQGPTDDPYLNASLAKFGVGLNEYEAIRQKDAITLLASRTDLDERFPTEFTKLQDIETILQIKDPADLQNENVQSALEHFNLDVNKYADEIVGFANIATVLKATNLKDLGSALAQSALVSLNFSPDLIGAYEYVAAIDTLADIKSPRDLLNPKVQTSLKQLNIDLDSIAPMLGKAGDINALLSIKNPEDLLKPQTIQALGDLNIINVDSELMGQIGAVTTLFQVRSVGDLFNPNTLLALNQLGIIALSNPVIGALTVIGWVSSFLGFNIFGGCKGNTNCYKPAAQNNVHTVVSELLQFPYDMGKPSYYRVTQLITYSEERDVLPFSDQLDQLYGKGRPNNYGLFAMPEAHDHIHIGY